MQRIQRQRSLTISLLLALVLTLMTSPALADSATAALGETGERFYQVVFIYMKDPARFQEYAQKLGPVVARYGGAAERIILPATVYPDTLRQPDMVNIVSYDNEEAYRRFENDPDFLAIRPIRDEAIDMMGINARVLGGALRAGDLATRPYMIEFAYFKDDDAKAYRTYQKKAGPVLGRHGFHTERALQPVSAFGDLDMPHQVNIHFFESQEQRARSEKDPDHPELERLYAESLDRLIWIEGQAMTH